MEKIYNIVLVLKTGGDYSIDDVNLLSIHIHKYWDKNKDAPNIYCITNLTNEKVKMAKVTLLPMENLWEGWWSKMNLFSPSILDLRPFLFMDLDTMVVGDISEIYFPDKEAFITLENIGEKGRLGSGLMKIDNNKKLWKVWDRWIRNPSLHTRIHRGDQDFINYIVGQDLFWQDITDTVTSAKPNFKMRTEMPENKKIIYFHGYPRIPEAGETIEWVKKYVNYEI